MIGLRFTAKPAVLFAVAAIVFQPALSQSTAHRTAPVPGNIHTMAVPTARVVAKVDNGNRTTLYGHLSAALLRATDMGRLDPSTPSEHMVMVLKSSDDQERELRRLLDEQQDSKTANYHQWATPEQFGQYFGVHDSDIAQVSAWLESQGFTVEDVSKSKRVIHFSGTTGQLETAFRTEMHTFQVNGETHVSNNSEISVPTALSPVIAGVTLNNFFRKSRMTPVRHLKDLTQSPNYTANSTTHYVGPWDFATIYNTFPLLNAGITGSGSSIAVVGRSDILLSDVQSYRTLFGLPDNDPIFIHAGQDNGTQPGDDGESDLDVEISGGIAPNAQVYFVIGTPTFLVDGITNSIEYIVENNTAEIMSISYGSCESVEGAGGNEFNLQAFEQAAAQGMSVFVAAGDNGPAECDDQNDSYENLGYSTGAESSTPYTVSVGGTGLAESLTTTVQSSILTTSTTGPEYWSATTENTPPYWGLSALSYIPETPWNISKVADYSASPTADLAGLWSGSGGISSYYIQPSWQRGSGVPTTDPALTNGGDWVTGYTITNAGSGYTSAPTVTLGTGCLTKPALTAVISGGAVTGFSVNYGSQGGTLAGGQGFGCTSAPTITLSAPSSGTTATATLTIGPMWNTLPLISGVPHRYTPDIALNADDGNDPTIFCSEGVCEFTTNSSTGVTTLSDAGLVGGTSVAAPSMAGIQALINQANGGRQGAPNYIYYTLSAAQTESGCNSAAEVYNASSVGSTCAFHDITAGDNLICGESSCTKGTYPTALSAAKMGWLAGTGYDLATGLGSVNAANLSSQWGSVVFNSSNTTLSLSQTTGIPQGGSVTFSGAVAAGSGTGTPTGDVAFILSQGTFGATVNVNTGAWNSTAPFATLSGGTYTATLSNLPAGTYTVTARYGGDQNFASSMSAPVTVTVAPGNSTLTITPGLINQSACTLNTPTTTFSYGQLVYFTANAAATSGQGVPTGTITYTVDGTTYATETLDPQGNGYLVAGAIPTSSCIYDYLIAQSPTLTGGVHTIGASYSGDSTFSPAIATPVVVTVTPLTVTPTLAAGATFIAAGQSDQLTATFTTSALTGTTSASSGPTGTVTFTDTTTSTILGSATVNPTVSFSGNTYTFAANTSLTTTGIVASGAHSITAAYSGDTNFSTATSAAVTVTVGTGVGTTTVISSSANPTTLNGRPTLTATIGAASGTVPTTGTVSFYDSYSGNPVLLGTGAVGSNHTATYRPASGTAFFGGTHPITAVYSGIAANSGSTSPVFAQSVTLGTTSIALAGKAAGIYGEAFSYAAVLTPSSTNATFAPNQSVVNFYDGTTLIGSSQPITITSSQGGYGLWTATLTTNALSAGTHSITATYSDINYSPSTSNAQTVTVSQASQAITFTAGAPASAVYNSSFTVAAKGGGSGIALAYTSAGVCSNVGSTYTMTSGTGTCTVIVNQAGNSNYLAAAQVTQTVNATLAAQAITFTTGAPASAVYNSSFMVAASASSGLAVTYSSSGVCGNVGAIYTMTSGTGTCTVIVNQAGNTNYSAATQVTQTVNAALATQTISFGTSPPASAVYNTSFHVAASATSGLAVAYTSSGGCTNSGATYTMTSGTTACSVIVNQGGNANYSAATQVTQAVNAAKAVPSIALMTSASQVLVSNPVTFTATATGPTAPTGIFTFYSGATPIGTSTTLVAGIGSLTISTLTTGSQSITATYSGDANYLTTTSAVLTEVVEDFSLGIVGGLTSQSVSPGGVAVYTFTLSPAAPATTFPSAITLTATGLPAGATFTFSPSSIAAGAGSTSITLTVQTADTKIAGNVSPRILMHNNLSQSEVARSGPANSGSPPTRQSSRLPMLALALLLLPLAGRLRRTGRKLSRMLPLVLLMLAGIAVVAGLSGCGSQTGYFGQAPVIYTIQISGTSGNLTHSTSLTLTVE